MPYISHFEYVESLPEDCMKIEKIRQFTANNLYWSNENKSFYQAYLNKDGNIKRIRRLVPNSKGLVFACNAVDRRRSITIAVNKWLRQHSDEN